MPEGSDNPTHASQRAVVVGRLILFVFASVAVVVAFVVAREHGGEKATPGMAGRRYVCPMHPQVTSDIPGDCPICHMALEPAAEFAREMSTTADEIASEEASSISRALLLPPSAADLVRYSIGLVRGHVLPQEIYAPAWTDRGGIVTASLYKDEIAALEIDERVRFVAAGAPELAIDAHRTSEPVTPWDRSTGRVRFRLDPNAYAPNEGQTGWIKLAHKQRRMLVVASTAVLESPEGPYVLAYSVAHHTFTKQPVEIGKVFSGFTAVVSGVRERDVIVAMNAFFFDAERRLRAKTERPAEGMP